jgi:hypothetical protein
VNGLAALWVRARSTEPLPPTPGRSLPVVDRISLRTVVENDGLQPDAAFVDGLKLDLSKSFYPFGQAPQPGTALYLANEEAFAKPGAEVTLSAQVAATPLDSAGSGTKAAAPTLAAEYWNGGAWADLGLASSDLNAFLAGTALTFTVPADLEPTRLNGQDGRWVRVRIVSGGFYRTNTITWSVVVDDAEVANTIVVSETVPPALRDFDLAYRYESPQDGPQACMTYNDFQWLDRSQEAFWRGGTFEPFMLTEDRTPAVYFGFDRPLPVDLLGLYFDIEEQPGERAPVLRWEAFDGRDWLSVAVGDETANLARPGMVSATWPGERPRASGEAVQTDGARVQLASAQQAAAFRPGDRLYIGETDKGELVTVEAVCPASASRGPGCARACRPTASRRAA